MTAAELLNAKRVDILLSQQPNVTFKNAPRSAPTARVAPPLFRTKAPAADVDRDDQVDDAPAQPPKRRPTKGGKS